MWLDVKNRNDAPSTARGIRFTRPSEVPAVESDDLHFHSETMIRAMNRMMDESPHRVHYFAAWDRHGLVGHATLALTPGPTGIGSLHDVAVRPRGRGKDIGTVLMEHVCRQVEKAGCRYIATSASRLCEHLYRRMGFTVMYELPGWWISGENLRAQIADGEIAFQEALGRGRLSALYIPRRRARLYEPNIAGVTPLDIAIKIARSLSLVDALLDAGADPNGIARHRPLILCAEEGLPRIVERLIKQGADPSLADADDRTPRSVAEDRGHQTVIDAIT